MAVNGLELYSDDTCSKSLSTTEGSSNGTCTQFGRTDYHSFRVVSLGTNCVVTLYDSDMAYCSSTKLSVARFG